MVVTVVCVGGQADGATVTVTHEAAQGPLTRIVVPVREGCGCLGRQHYEMWGELALAWYYEPPPLHCLTSEYTHPPTDAP